MGTSKSISIVVAVARNGVIGFNNGLPWRLPDDLKRFKKITNGHPIVMGRKTFDSIGRSLPGRDNIVVTRQKNWCAENVKVTSSLEAALTVGAECASKHGVREIMVIGGADFYRQVLPVCDRVYLTEVHADIKGDAFFPDLRPDDWLELSREDFDKSDENSHPFSFVVLDRRD